MAATADRQILRAHWHDYCEPGTYMLTMSVENRAAMPFGSITGDSEQTAAIALTPLGTCLQSAVNDIPKYYPDIIVIDSIVMGDHCHILLRVTAPLKKHLGNVVRALKSVTTKAYLNDLSARYGSIFRTTSNPKGYREKAAGNTGRNRTATIVIDGISVDASIVPPLWAEGYNDRIVMRPRQLAKLRSYIRRNPARLWLKRHADRSLMAVSDIRIPVSMPLAVRLKQQAAYWDLHRHKTQTTTSTKVYARSYTELTQRFLRKTVTDGGIQPFVSVRACGNIDLLRCGRPLVSVRISRSVTPDALHDELHRLLDLCEREGAIIISPFISWSEKEVLKAARANGYPHIIVSGEAMSRLYKPSDATHAIESQYTPAWHRDSTAAMTATTLSDMACTAAGTLLTLAPWFDRPQSEKPAKPDCEMINALCQLLADNEAENSEQ